MCVCVCVWLQNVCVFDGDGNRSRFFRGPLELRGVVCVCVCLWQETQKSSEIINHIAVFFQESPPHRIYG